MPASFPVSVRPVVLLILDGFGCREATPDNAIARARKPNWDRLLATCPHTSIDASELAVGLPDGQMGNSEVGHLNMGAGRVVYQDLTRIDLAIRSGEFAANPVLRDAAATAAATGNALHILGLLSPGGVHSHERHIAAMVELAAAQGVPRIFVHAFLDGRDTPPQSALASLVALDAVCARHPGARIASIVGRYYAMDRDKRWDRVRAAYELLVDGSAAHTATSAEAGLAAAYARGENDEFVAATAIVGADGKPATMRDGDTVVFMNFRADRAREITRALTDPAFDGFARTRVPKLARYACLTSYGDEFSALPVAFAPQSVGNGFGEYLANRGLRQLRIAETEKYAHVTYFFSGGTETPYPGEDRILVPSPKVATYDLKPEMSAGRSHRPAGGGHCRRQVRRDRVQLRERRHGRPHRQSGGRDPRHRNARSLHRARRRRGAQGGRRGADHRRSRQRRADVRSADRTAAYRAHAEPRSLRLRRAAGRGWPIGGALSDIAPTLLAMLGLPPPAEMTGHSLLRFS